MDPVLEGRRQLFGVALCVSWGTWPRMEGFAVVACGESFVLPGGQTSRSVDAAAQGAAHGIGYNSRATIVLLVTTTGMFCDKASWSIVSRQKGSALQPGRNRSCCGAIYVFSELGGKVDRKKQGQHEGHWSVAQARQQRIWYTGAGRVGSREIRSGWSDRALPISFTAGGKGTVRQTEVVAVKENKDEMCAGQQWVVIDSLPKSSDPSPPAGTQKVDFLGTSQIYHT